MINTRVGEHERHCSLLQREKCSVAEHALAHSDHKILFDETEVLSNTYHYLACLHEEAIEIQKHKNRFNKKDESQRVKRFWYLVLSVYET